MGRCSHDMVCPPLQELFEHPLQTLYGHDSEVSDCEPHPPPPLVSCGTSTHGPSLTPGHLHMSHTYISPSPCPSPSSSSSLFFFLKVLCVDISTELDMVVSGAKVQHRHTPPSSSHSSLTPHHPHTGWNLHHPHGPSRAVPPYAAPTGGTQV